MDSAYIITYANRNCIEHLLNMDFQVRFILSLPGYRVAQLEIDVGSGKLGRLVCYSKPVVRFNSHPLV